MASTLLLPVVVIRSRICTLAAICYICCCCYNSFAPSNGVSPVMMMMGIGVMAFRIQPHQRQQLSVRPVLVPHTTSSSRDPSQLLTIRRSKPAMLPLFLAAGGRGMSKKVNIGSGDSTTTDKATGMGMGSSSTTKNSKKKSTSSSSSATATTPFNVNASLSRLEKKYDELTKANAKVIRRKDDTDDDDDDDYDDANTSTDKETNDNVASGSSSSNRDEDDDDDDAMKMVTTEYVVAVRAEGYISDWVPIAQYCMTRTNQQASNSDGVSDPIIQAGISYYCRELFHVATLGSRIFTSIPRNVVQYSVETLDSFHKHVYETTIQPSSSSSSSSGSKNNNGVDDDDDCTSPMTKDDARNELELINGDGTEPSVIKRAYRTLSFANHPDRFIGIDRTTEEIQLTHRKYLRIQLAYETLNSGIRNGNKKNSSWYQSLGGKARNDFIGPISLLSIDTGKTMLEMNQIESAITCMSPSIVQTFVARCK